MRAAGTLGYGGSPYQEIGGAAGGAPVARVIAVHLSNTTTTAQNLTAPVAGTYRLVLCGAGASGAAVAGRQGAASGAGSGGVVVSKAFPMAAGQTQAVTFGTPGAGRSVTNTVGNGIDATDTTATMPDGTGLVAGGGKGGAFLSTATGTVVGGLGGAATGGEFNYPGNAGGAVTYTSSSNIAAANGGADTYVVGSASFVTPILGNAGATATGMGAGGGGNPPSALGLIPPQTGVFGFVSTVASTRGGASNTPFNHSWGSGGTVTTATSGTLVSAPGGPAAAYLILEVPLS